MRPSALSLCQLVDAAVQHAAASVAVVHCAMLCELLIISKFQAHSMGRCKMRKSENVHAKQVLTLDTALLYGATSSQKRSGMARVVEGSHSFTCHPRVYNTNGMSHTCLSLSGWQSTRPKSNR